MTIIRGDYVRLNNHLLALPRASVWLVIGTIGGLSLFPVNAEARAFRHLVDGLRFKPNDFEAVTAFNGQWVPVPPESPVMPADTVPNEELPKILFANADAAAAAQITAEVAAEQASWASAAYAGLLKDARKLEAERRQEVRKAKAAKAKADKEAAARAKVEETRKALAARLHADRCLGEATLELIAEVSRLHNGGPEAAANPSIANHADQLQPLARSYGYRIVKPSMVALVVKL